MNEILSTVVLFGDGHGTSAVTGGGFVNSLIFLIVIALILGILLWVVQRIPVIPPVFKTFLTWVIYFVAVVILINFLLSLVGRPLFVY